MTFFGIEFSESEGGGLALIHRKWLTPRKSNVWWPPFKQSDRFEKCLNRGDSPNETWKLFCICRTYFEEAIYEKARKKLRKAEVTSEITSGEDSGPTPTKRSRKPNKRLFSSSDEESNTPSVYPMPPKVKLKSNLLTSSSKLKRTKAEQSSAGNLTGTSCAQSPTFINRSVTPVIVKEKTIESVQGDLGDASDFKKILKQILVVKQQNQEILNILRNSQPSIKSIKPEVPVNLPVQNTDELNILEEYLLSGNNILLMEQYYTNFGGKDVTNKTNNLLKCFLSNKHAVQYSFLGSRNAKRPFSQLKLRNLIVNVVLQSSQSVTEHEVNNAIKTWLKHAPKRLKAEENRNRL